MMNCTCDEGFRSCLVSRTEAANLAIVGNIFLNQANPPYFINRKEMGSYVNFVFSLFYLQRFVLRKLGEEVYHV